MLHPLVAVELAIAIILIQCLPRKYVIVPLLLTILLTSRAQVLVLAGVHFPAARILILAALVRWAVSGGPSALAISFNAIDRVYALLAISSLSTFSLQWMQSQAFIKGLADFLDALGGYFVMRFLIQDREDITRTVKVLALVAVIMAPFMINEQITHRNLFGLLDGTTGQATSRDGQIRSQAAFAVYITAGVFGASLLPLFIWLWTSGKSKTAGCLGGVAATVITMTSHSSTPLLAYAGGIVGLCFWPLRERMRAFRWGLVLSLTAVHLAMKAPVWALIARVDLTGSSSGYHRFMLVDTCIRHFGEWWLIGVKDYNNWGFDMWDLSNQYVAFAVTGGLASLVLFILVISRGFGRLGRARKQVAGDRHREWLLWCLCAALLSHTVAYFGIGYFDQMQFAWCALLAMICAAVSEAMGSKRSAPETVRAPSSEIGSAVGWATLRESL